jgi:hypothetical protein
MSSPLIFSGVRVTRSLNVCVCFVDSFLSFFLWPVCFSVTVKSHESGNDREVLTTSGAYPWSFVTQIFHNGQQSHGGDRKTFEVMT